MRRWTIILTLAFVCWSSRPARADLASSLYGDIRDVVEELIESEITTSVVATLKVRSPALAFYMHGTFERLASPYWGSLGRTLKAELTVMIADFVYWHMSVGGGNGDVVGSVRRFFSCSTSDKKHVGCMRLTAAIQEQSRSLLEVECRRNTPAPSQRVACDVALAVRAALEQRGEVRRHLIDALSDVVLQEISDRGMLERSRDVLTRWLEFKKDLPTTLLETLGNPELGAMLEDASVDKLCKDVKLTIDSFLNDPAASPAWICFATNHTALNSYLNAGVSIRDPKVVTKNGAANSLSPGWLHSAIEFSALEARIKGFDFEHATEDATARVFVDFAMDRMCPPADPKTPEAPACLGIKLEPGTRINIWWNFRNNNGVVNANGQIEMTAPVPKLATTAVRFQKAMQKIAELRTLVPPSLKAYVFAASKPLDPTAQATAQASAQAMLRSMNRMARLVTELRARWYLWQTDAKSSIEDLDVAELLEVARSSLGATKSGVDVLAFLDKNGMAGAATIDIGDWFRFVMRADYRSLAMESLRAALDLRLGDSSRPAETFFLTLASYLLDAGDGVGEQVARSAFRASAKELLLSQSQKGVPRLADRTRFTLLPRLALKLSFNDIYGTTDDNNNRRNVVSAEWPTVMYAITDYIGLEASAIDFIAPLAEMALRPPGKYHSQGLILADVIRPRVGVWIAAPQLSRRIALTIGLGLRFLGVDRTDDPLDEPAPLEASYTLKASLALDAGLQFVF